MAWGRRIRRPRRPAGLVLVLAAAAAAQPTHPPPEHAAARPTAGPCAPCDVNCDALVDGSDIPTFVALLLAEAVGCSSCAGDVDASGGVDGRDIQPFVDCALVPPQIGACCLESASCADVAESACGGLWLGASTACAGDPCSFANLTAHRPRRRSGYFPFPKTAIADADEESPTAGPGIRIHAPGDDDPAGEDDLIEVLVETARPGVPLALRRSDAALRLWTTPTREPGSEIAFIADRTDALPLAPGGTAATIWVEWAAAAHGVADLTLEPLAAGYALDILRFHTIRSIVMALGGEDQVPSSPIDPNHGTFVVALALYQQGFDVHVHDEDDVAANGTGPVLNEVVTAVRDRRVEQVSIFGYSHGGGSTYSLANRLDVDRPGIGVFEIIATSYVDSIGNASDFDISQELRRPPSSGYHANHYQIGSVADFFLDGGPVPDSDSVPTGQNVETAFGVTATHWIVDDFEQVRGFIATNFTLRLAP